MSRAGCARDKKRSFKHTTDRFSSSEHFLIFCECMYYENKWWLEREKLGDLV